MMIAASAGGGGELPRAVPVGTTTQLLTAGVRPTIALDLAATGAVAGDFCMVFTTNPGELGYSSLSGGAGGWAQDNYTWTPAYGYRASNFAKVLEAADLSGTVTFVSGYGSGGGDIGGPASIMIAVYRGARSAARRTISMDQDGDASQTVAGFTRGYTCVGVVCAIFDRDTDANTYTVSGGWTKRFNTTIGSWRGSIADALGKTDYVDGASLTWGNLGTSGPYAQVAQMYELMI